MAETFLYLTTTGRKTGNPHEIEIWFVPQGDYFYLCAGGGEKADWVQNIQHNPTVTFYIAERDQPTPAQPAEAIIPDPDVPLVKQVKTLFDEKYNWSDGLIVEIRPKDDAE